MTTCDFTNNFHLHVGLDQAFNNLCDQYRGRTLSKTCNFIKNKKYVKTQPK